MCIMTTGVHRFIVTRTESFLCRHMAILFSFDNIVRVHIYTKCYYRAFTTEVHSCNNGRFTIAHLFYKLRICTFFDGSIHSSFHDLITRQAHARVQIEYICAQRHIIAQRNKPIRYLRSRAILKPSRFRVHMKISTHSD